MRIEQALLAIPAIVACYLVSGSSDFLVEAVVPDLAGYEQLLLGQILAIPVDRRGPEHVRHPHHPQPRPAAPGPLGARTRD